MTFEDIKSYLTGRLNILKNDRPKMVEAIHAQCMFESIELQRARYDLVACDNRIQEVEMALGAFEPKKKDEAPATPAAEA